MPKGNYPYRYLRSLKLIRTGKFFTDFYFFMSKETYQEIKRISGEELKELLSDLDNVFDLGTGNLMGNSYLTSPDC